MRGSCPDACQALTRTTGYQAKVGPDRDLYQAPANGRIVAWTVALGKPGPKQTAFFEERYGGTSQAAVVVLDPGKKLLRTVMAKAPLQKLTDYFGQTVQFPLAQALRIRKGQYVGLTVPTWAPTLQIGLGSDTSWRSSRAQAGCLDVTTQFALLGGPHVGDVPLPVPDGAADLQRDVHPRSRSATRRRAERARPGSAGWRRRRGCPGRSSGSRGRSGSRRRSSACRRRSPAPAPPVVEAAGGGGGATTAGGCTTAGGAAPAGGIVEVAIVDVVVVVSAGGSSVVAVGIVRSGDVRGMSLDSSSSAPHALEPARQREGGEQRCATRGHRRSPTQATGSMRRSQCGQSLRSRCASWSHQLQKRRYSTAHGRRDCDGASGRTLPTTSSVSPLSRSTYTRPGSASTMISRSVAGVRMR